MNRYPTILPLVLAAVAWLAPTRATADARGDFLAAEQAFKQGDRARYEQLAARLLDYPLYPYLRYLTLSADLDSGRDAEIASFLDQEPDSALALRLRQPYLDRLAAARRWAEYARLYRPDDSLDRRCLYLRALIETGRSDEAMAQVEAIWVASGSQRPACDAVFDAWRAAGHLTVQLTWRRIRLALEGGDLGLARTLAKRLPDAEQVWFERWLAVDKDPRRVLDREAFAADHPLRAAILAHGIVRLARRAPDDAALAWQRQRERLTADPAANDRAAAAVGRALYRAGDPHGFEIWDALVADADDIRDQEARLRAAVDRESWEWVAKWVAAMPAGDAKSDRWLYWQGRAESALGRAAAARASFGQAALGRSLWAFLAADRLGLAYALGSVPTPAEPARIRRLVLTPAYRRIQELRRLGRDPDVRREWRALTRDLDNPDLLAAAYIADVLRWHDQAVFTLARSGYWDDLELRFPLQYRDLVQAQSDRTGLDADWIFAIIRQESVFARTIASSAGAIGLMQLLPSTAAELAPRLGLPAPSRWDLFDPTLNITLGSSYLAWMSDRFGHPALATAAYNAGPGQVMRWLPERPTAPDLWIARIPFAETRSYVERVMAYRVIYAARLGRDGPRVSTLLTPIPSAAQVRARGLAVTPGPG